jgi:PAS domain S-box-containing protein/putative nucleotidyltransferase with HDIG domain
MPTPLRVLIVEDTPDDAELMLLRLRQEGFQPDWTRVQTEPDYLAALATAPDLILADWSLPQFSGLRALKLMGAHGLAIPFIIVSGGIGEETAADALHQGADDYVLKDRPQRLGPAVRRALQEKQLRVERQRIEEALRASEEQYRSLAQTASDAIITADAGGQIIAWNLAAERMFQYTEAEALGQSLESIMPEAYRGAYAKRMTLLQTDAEPRVVGRTIELTGLRKDGSQFPVELSLAMWKTQQGQFFSAIVRDITERKRAEEALAEERNLLRTLIDNLPDAIYAKDTQGRYVIKNLADAALTGAKSTEEIVGKSDFDYYPPELAAHFTADDQAVIQSGQPLLNREEPNVGPTGDKRWILTTKVPWRDGKGQIIGLVGIGHDITVRRQREERIRRQLEHLTALREIDRAISSSFDLRFNLVTTLNQLTVQLGVDAADVLLYRANSQTLECAADHGFRTTAIQNTRLRLGQGHAGRAALERHTVRVADLRTTDTSLATVPLADEGFVSYIGVPLIAKGQIKGVLELFHRSPLDPDEEWLDFLDALTAQAAIAIDNATLFESLQRANTDLAQAYDATIEGWSRALDMRDQETEGHTQRVTEMTVRLARACGLSDVELKSVRWGALLHDIGKMGIPDNILLKPGPLTVEEWNVMRQHPVLAYEMLAPIHYLRAALDIPYSHHEWWDGEGYPLGLKGEQIPLAARIFAVVDVWDALRSQRPYRSAWLDQKVIEYLRKQAHTHFDPHVVDVFLTLLATEELS